MQRTRCAADAMGQTVSAPPGPEERVEPLNPEARIRAYLLRQADAVSHNAASIPADRPDAADLYKFTFGWRPMMLTVESDDVGTKVTQRLLPDMDDARAIYIDKLPTRMLRALVPFYPNVLFVASEEVSVSTASAIATETEHPSVLPFWSFDGNEQPGSAQCFPRSRFSRNSFLGRLLGYPYVYSEGENLPSVLEVLYHRDDAWHIAHRKVAETWNDDYSEKNVAVSKTADLYFLREKDGSAVSCFSIHENRLIWRMNAKELLKNLLEPKGFLKYWLSPSAPSGGEPRISRLLRAERGQILLLARMQTAPGEDSKRVICLVDVKKYADSGRPEMALSKFTRYEKSRLWAKYSIARSGRAILNDKLWEGDRLISIVDIITATGGAEDVNLFVTHYVTFSGEFLALVPYFKFLGKSSAYLYEIINGPEVHLRLVKRIRPSPHLRAMQFCEFRSCDLPKGAPLVTTTTYSEAAIVERTSVLPGASVEEHRCRVCGQRSVLLCKGCKKARYCSDECQAADWIGEHSKSCV